MLHQVGQTLQNWGFLPGLVDDIIPFRANNSVLPSLWISFLSSITMFFTCITLIHVHFYLTYLPGQPVHVLLQPHSTFIPLPCCQHLLGLMLPLQLQTCFVTHRSSILPPSKIPAHSYATLCCHKNLCSSTANHVREPVQIKSYQAKNQQASFFSSAVLCHLQVFVSGWDQY